MLLRKRNNERELINEIINIWILGLSCRHATQGDGVSSQTGGAQAAWRQELGRTAAFHPSEADEVTVEVKVSADKREPSLRRCEPCRCRDGPSSR